MATKTRIVLSTLLGLTPLLLAVLGPGGLSDCGDLRVLHRMSRNTLSLYISQMSSVFLTSSHDGQSLLYISRGET